MYHNIFLVEKKVCILYTLLTKGLLDTNQHSLFFLAFQICGGMDLLERHIYHYGP